jgi:hypothetical protein
LFLLGSAFAATVVILPLAAYRATSRVIPSCGYVETLGAALDADDAPLVARHESDTPRHAGVIDLGPLAVRWDSAYAGHATSTGEAHQMTVGTPHSCDAVSLDTRLVPRSTSPNLTFELYHREGSDVYRVVALDGPARGATRAGNVSRSHRPVRDAAPGGLTTAAATACA